MGDQDYQEWTKALGELLRDTVERASGEPNLDKRSAIWKEYERMSRIIKRFRGDHLDAEDKMIERVMYGDVQNIF